MELLVFLVVTWILCGVTAAVIASSRNRDVTGWSMLGCLLGVFALIMVLALPAAHKEQPPEPSPASWLDAVGLLVALGGFIVLGIVILTAALVTANAADAYQTAEVQAREIAEWRDQTHVACLRGFSRGEGS